MLLATSNELRIGKLRRRVRVADPLALAAVTCNGFRSPQAWFVTLTYAKPDAWQPRDISGLVNALRKRFARQGVPIAGYWCAEMQEKRFQRLGERAIHYHAIVYLPHGMQFPKLDDEGLWRHGITRRDKVQKSAVGYVMKYQSKGHHVPLPKGSRIFGQFGLGHWRPHYSWGCRPAWLRDFAPVGQRIERVTGVGWLNVHTGEVTRSPWRVDLLGGGVVRFTRMEALRPDSGVNATTEARIEAPVVTLTSANVAHWSSIDAIMSRNRNLTGEVA